MSAKKGGFQEKFYGKIAPIITGLGAAVVILGALFKIMHWDGAGPMLIVGLGTEALLFAMFAFAPQPHDPAWERVYPELDDEKWALMEGGKSQAKAPSAGASSLDQMISNAKIDQNMIDRLGKGFTGLADSVAKMNDISGAAVATKEYAANVQNASKALTDMNKSYAATVAAMAEMSNAAQDSKEYHAKVQAITKSLGALNAVYELELKDADNHLKAMNKFYGNLSNAMSNMADASKDAEAFKSEISKLTGNLSSLNKVYGNMLTAMKGGAAA
jgi:gliding motility-associated protein GldL